MTIHLPPHLHSKLTGQFLHLSWLQSSGAAEDIAPVARLVATAPTRGLHDQAKAGHHM